MDKHNDLPGAASQRATATHFIEALQRRPIMKRFFLATTLAAGMFVFTAPTFAQFVAGSPQTPGFNGNGNGAMRGKRNGPNDGTGNQGVGPKDGTGYGAKAGNKQGGGVCDNTGPKGRASQGRGAQGGRGGRR